MKKTLKYLLSFLLAALLLWLAFRGVDWGAFRSGLAGTDWRWIAASMALGLLAFTTRALRWNQLLRPLDPEIGFRKTLEGVCIGNMANCALPFSGEFVRCGVVSTKKAGYDRTLGTIALERTVDLVSIAVIFLLIFLFKWDEFGEFFGENIWAPAVARIGAGAWIAAAALLLLACLAVWAVAALRDRVPLCRKVADVVKRLFQGFSSVAKMDRKGMFLAYTAFLWALYWGMAACIARALPQAAALQGTDTLFLMAVGSIASVIPVPGGFGAYHYILALTLSTLYSFSWDAGILFATLSHESQALMMILTGAASWAVRTVGGRK